jgi:hypothetical protein
VFDILDFGTDNESSTWLRPAGGRRSEAGLDYIEAELRNKVAVLPSKM